MGSVGRLHGIALCQDQPLRSSCRAAGGGGVRPSQAAATSLLQASAWLPHRGVGLPGSLAGGLVGRVPFWQELSSSGVGRRESV